MRAYLGEFRRRFGGQYHSQLGDGTTAARHTPTRIGTATNWASLSAGGAHAVAA